MSQPPATGSSRPPHVAIVGAGPAGLAAAEVLGAAGARVDLFDAMPSVGRKFLLAGRGGLNLTHSEEIESFLARYGAARPALEPMVRAFDAEALREWARGLGVETFVGTSGRVFPRDLKAAPLLRAWLHRLREAGVTLHSRHHWTGWDDAGRASFSSPTGATVHAADALVLALGGASWPQLGSDGAWVPVLEAAGVDVAPLQASNCGFDVQRTGQAAIGWSDYLRQRFAGQPVKPVVASCVDVHGRPWRQAGEFVLTDCGVEGSLVYAASATLREAINANGSATLWLDLLPQHSAQQVLAEVGRPRGPRSWATHLKSRLGIQGLKLALLHELLPDASFGDPEAMARTLKAMPLQLVRTSPIEEAISSAGGVRWSAIDERLMLRQRPGVFCAGEMLDWEAPTGGYLLTACIASGHAAAAGVLAWWMQR